MSPTADAVVGMMDAAYFVGRKGLLDFLNDTLGLKLQKIEQTASGAVACQLFHIMYPESIPMSKVNWAAKSDYEFVQNYKILQGGFNKHHVQRHVDVDKLIRAKYQDNLEFMQWFKAFFDHSGGPNNLPGYNPHEARARGKGGDRYNAQFGVGGGGAATSARPSLPTRRVASSAAAVSKGRAASSYSSSTNSAPAGSKSSIVSCNPSSPRQHRPLRERPEQPTAKTGMTTSKDLADPQQSAIIAGFEAQVQDLQRKVEDLEVAVMDVEKERDFYFEKLRNVEVLLQVHQEKDNSLDASADNSNNNGATMPVELVDKIFKVLYATPEDEVIVTNDGELIPADQILSQELSSTAL